MTPSDEQIRAAIAEQAGEWFVAQQAGPLAEEESAAFLAWLRASPVHVREYLGVARVAHHLAVAVGAPSVPLQTFLAQAQAEDESVVAIRAQTPRRRASVARGVATWAVPIAASLIAVGIGALWYAHDGELLGIPKTYRTAHGEQSIERLPDGSILRLDTDSEVTVRYSSRERRVDLNRGQALFEVTHEGGRRFRVKAGNAGAIAVGTRFDVYREAGVTELTVAEGEIVVFTGEPWWLWTGNSAPAEVQHLSAGFQIRIDDSGLAAQPVPVDLIQKLAWAEHKLVFERRPLGEVAAEFNRYSRIPVEIEGEELRSLPVSGMFDASDAESFVAFLERLPGVKVERTPKRIRVVKATPTT